MATATAQRTGSGTQQGGEIVKVRPTQQELATIGDLEQVLADCGTALSDAAGRVHKTFAMAKAIGMLRELLTDDLMRTHIAPLMNSPLGFLTDKNPARKVKDRDGNWKYPEPYEIPVVRDCLIEALIKGANVVGNEFNIISSRAYFTKEFFERAVGELPGVTNVVPSPGVPRKDGDKTVIRFGLAWKVNGVADCLRDAEGKPGRVFEIKADAYSTADQVIGKATRKAYAAAYRQITGSTLADGDTDGFVEGEVVGTGEKPAGAAGTAAARLEQMRQQGAGKNGAGTPAAPTSPPEQQPPDQGQQQHQQGEADPDARGADAEPPGGAARLPADLSTWDKFESAMTEAAMDAQVESSVAAAAIGKLKLGPCGATRTSVNQQARRDVMAAVADGQFDWKAAAILK